MRDTKPVSELLPAISSTLLSCSTAECTHQLSALLKQLRPGDISTLLLELDLLEIPVGQKLAVVDALVRSGNPETEALSVWASPDEGEELVERLLFHIATGNTPPSRSVMNAAP